MMDGVAFLLGLPESVFRPVILSVRDTRSICDLLAAFWAAHGLALPFEFRNALHLRDGARDVLIQTALRHLTNLVRHRVNARQEGLHSSLKLRLCGCRA